MCPECAAGRKAAQSKPHPNCFRLRAQTECSASEHIQRQSACSPVSNKLISLANKMDSLAQIESLNEWMCSWTVTHCMTVGVHLRLSFGLFGPRSPPLGQAQAELQTVSSYRTTKCIHFKTFSNVPNNLPVSLELFSPEYAQNVVHNSSATVHHQKYTYQLVQSESWTSTSWCSQLVRPVAS